MYCLVLIYIIFFKLVNIQDIRRGKKSTERNGKEITLILIKNLFIKSPDVLTNYFFTSNFVLFLLIIIFKKLNKKFKEENSFEIFFKCLGNNKNLENYWFGRMI